MATPTATLVETRGLRPFKSSEEYLYAMKEDLAEWLNNLYAELHMNVANFMDRLDTGVTLCRHANNVRRYAEEHMAKRQAQGKDVHSIAISVLNLPPVKHLPGAKPGTFFARDNVSNFIGWSRRGLGVFECLLFETDDLIMRKNEKHVILCLLEVARRGAKLGMPAPMLIQLEREIDREIAADKKKLGFSDNEYYDADLEDDLSDSDDEAQYGPLPQIVTNDLKSLDEMVRDLVARCTCPTQFPMIRVSEGKYRIGDTKVLIFVRVLRSHVMVRVGGGWDTLSHYLDKHDPCRCKTSHRAAASAKLVGVRSGGPAIDINQAQVHYERSPPRTRRSSASSTGSGGGTTAPPNPSLLTPSHTAARANRNRSRSPTPRLDTLSPRVDNRRSRSPTPRRNVSRSTTPDPKGRGKLDRSRSISKNREYEYRGRSASKNRDSDTSRARSVSKNRDTEASRARSVSKNRDTDYRGRSASKTRGKEGDERKFSRSDSIHSYSGLLGDDRGRSCSNDYGNSRNGSLDCTSRNGSLDYASMRNGSLDYASPRNGSLDYASTRNGSLDYALGSRNSSLDYGNTRTGHLNHTDSTESYSLPYDINLGKLRSDSCISDSLDVSKINEEISKLNRTYNIDESSFLKRTNTNEYQSGIDSTPAPRVSDNFSRTYEQVNITRPVTPIQAKSRIDSGVDTTPSMRISDNFVSSASNDSSDEGYRSLGALHNKPVNTSAPVRSVSSLSSASSKPHRSRSTGAASPSPQSSPFRRNLSSQRSGSARVNGWNKPSPAVTTETKSNTWNSRSNGVKKRPTLEETTFVEQVADIMQQYASMIPSPRKDKLSSSSSGISSTRIPAPIHQRT